MNSALKKISARDSTLDVDSIAHLLQTGLPGNEEVTSNDVVQQ